jgi:CheY-like chemotaxis protein
MGRPRVLLVEDEALVAMMMEDLLQDLGCELAGSFSDLAAAQAWLAADRAGLDGALLDVNLGGGEMVFPLARMLRARRVPFAFATGYAELPDPDFPEAPMLRKPVDQDALAPIVMAFGARV